MRVLIGCEESATVREAFEKLGHDAWSCDLLPSRIPGKHIQADILTVLNDGWDLAIFHTPCTYLSNSGVRWLYNKDGSRNLERWELMERDALLFKATMEANIPMKANENPIMHKYAVEIIGRRQDQVIQPSKFGHPESKATCLWLQNLPPLVPTNDVTEIMKSLPKREAQRIHYMPPSPNRQRERSTTFPGIAQAMAQQWGSLAFQQERVPDVWESTPLQAFSHPETFATSQALSTLPTRR